MLPERAPSDGAAMRVIGGIMNNDTLALLYICTFLASRTLSEALGGSPRSSEVLQIPLSPYDSLPAPPSPQTEGGYTYGNSYRILSPSGPLLKTIEIHKEREKEIES